MIAAVMGTPFEIDAEGIILLIEDVNEPIYRIDRLLTHLRLAGKLAQVAGVLVGDVAGWIVPRWSACSSRPSNPCAFRCCPAGAAGIVIRI